MYQNLPASIDKSQKDRLTLGQFSFAELHYRTPDEPDEMKGLF